MKASLEGVAFWFLFLTPQAIRRRKSSTLSILAGSTNFTQRCTSHESVSPRVGGYGRAATFERYQTVFNAILFVILAWSLSPCWLLFLRQ